MAKYVYLFKEGNKDMRELLGGKGANLAEMTRIGLPVPKGFTITTEACTLFYKNNHKIGEKIQSEILKNITKLEKETGKKFGDSANPLLVSVRSGARVSMPGMMDTVLNLGMNDAVCDGMINKTENPRFVYDSYRRFIQMYADVVMGVPKGSFDGYLDDFKKKLNIDKDTDLTAEDLKELIKIYKLNYKKLTHEDFPTNPVIQLLEAVLAVFKSWMNDRAIVYRKLNDIPSSWGTAVNVQEMVYGNSGNDSGTGVAFTRNPSTGEKKLFGEYLINAQGEDVVAGVRTPEPISKLESVMPSVYNEFQKYANLLENYYHDMQDMEFTIENGKLYMLQTRNGKRTGEAAIKIAVDMVNERKITKSEAIMKVEPKQLESLLHPIFNKESLKKANVIGGGLAASPGAATGKIYFNAKDAAKAHEKGEKEIILIRMETSPEDIEGMHIAEGILTIRGGMTSHAAVVARGMGKCAVCGCQNIVVNENGKTITTATGKVFKEKDFISLDGSTGLVYEGKLSTENAKISGDFKTFMDWVDNAKKLKIRANADTPIDAKTALDFGAEGIGLCRTEHMFFGAKRIFAFRKMICSDTKEEREKALLKLLPFQRSDFEELFKTMNGYPVIIRYLDPPLHEFLPKDEKEIVALAKDLKITSTKLKKRIAELKEFNPMMGHRGCRLSITYPEIAVMQTRAVMEAAINVSKLGVKVKPEIMIPLVGNVNELKFVKNIVENTADDINRHSEVKVRYKVGTMIELPRACITADELAKEAEFFSFGTNDLTQMTYGFSRDDSFKFLNNYYDNNILTSDPFASIDQNGVGKLMKIGIVKGRRVNHNLEIGICGEHGGDPASVAFCDSLGLDYVSCSPYRVPIARLAAAQAAIKERRQ
jgi:pyruvate,orthophosphate dikinase